MGTALRVLIVEDDAHVVRALEKALRGVDPPIDIVRSCSSVAAAIAAVDDRAVAFDVALVDLALGDGSGLDVLRHIRATRPDAQSVVVTVFDEPRTVLDAIRAGARGYVLKDWTPDQIVSCVRDAAAGGAPMSPSIARLVLDTIRTNPAPAEEVALTGRETDVLALLCEGRTYREVAVALGIGIGTVQTRVKAIYGKLEVESKAELTAIAFRRGLVR